MEVEYILSSAAELGEVTPVECAALHLLDNAYSRVDLSIAQNEQMPDDFLQNTARAALLSATPEQRHWVALNSLASLPHLARSLRFRAEYLIQKKVQSDLGKAAPFRLIDGTAENGDAFWSEKIVHTEADVTETAARAILNRHMGSLMNRLSDDIERIERAIQWYQQDAGEQFRRLQLSHRATRHSRDSLSLKAYNEAMRAEKERKRRLNKRSARGAIKKVCKLFAQFRQEDNLRMFVSGQEVEMSHPESPFKFVFRPLGEPGWLEERSAKGRNHTPYDLSLLTKDEVFIARLCVYFDDTPVLDQLLAMAVFVQSGEELRILEKANFFGFSEGGSADTAKATLVTAYPSLERKFPKPKESTDIEQRDLADALVSGNDYPVIDLGTPFRAEEAHWEPFKGRVTAWVNTWFEPTLSNLLPKAQLLQIAA